LYIPTNNPISQQRGGVCAADFNRDGYLDLVCTIWNGTNHLFINNRDGTFTNASVSSGIGALSRFYHQPVAADFNGDKWPDIYITVDFAPNQLWINLQNGTFANMAASAFADNSMNDMGVSLGDFDNDGDFDIYITNIYNFDTQSQQQEHNILLQNETIGSIVTFVEVSMDLGVDQGHWGWGTSFFDCDNDGFLDIAATNGWRFAPFTMDPSVMYRNTGVRPYMFEDVSNDTGFNDNFYGSSLVAFDMDRDGDLDLAQTTMVVNLIPSSVRLLENEAIVPPGIGNFLVIKPRIDGPNHWAIGAVVRATTNGQQRTTQMRLITAGTSYLGQEPAEAFFGLGAAASADTVRVTWPDGTLTTLTGVSANQMLEVHHGGWGDLDADGFIQLDDWQLFQTCFRGPHVVAPNACLASDFNATRRVDLADAAIFQNRFTGP
jgi:hypothetical protein